MRGNVDRDEENQKTRKVNRTSVSVIVEANLNNRSLLQEIKEETKAHQMAVSLNGDGQ
jgi:hypothetical protein